MEINLYIRQKKKEAMVQCNKFQNKDCGSLDICFSKQNKRKGISVILQEKENMACAPKSTETINQF